MVQPKASCQGALRASINTIVNGPQNCTCLEVVGIPVLRYGVCLYVTGVGTRELMAMADGKVVISPFVPPYFGTA